MRAWIGLLAMALVVVACTGSEEEPAAVVTPADAERFSGADFEAGVPVAVDDPSAVVREAIVFHPPDDRFVDLHPRLEAGDAVVITDAAEFDVIILYRTGPFCGLLPDVDVVDGGDQIDIRIRPVDDGEDCESDEFDEAIGLLLEPDQRDRAIVVDHIPIDEGA